MFFPVTLKVVCFRNMIPSNLIEATFQQVSKSTFWSVQCKENWHNAHPYLVLKEQPLLAPLLFVYHLGLQYKTDLIPLLKTQDSIKQHNLVYLMPDDDHPGGHQVFLDLTPPPDIHYKAYPGSSHQMNVLGIVIFSATMGQTFDTNGQECQGEKQIKQ